MEGNCMLRLPVVPTAKSQAAVVSEEEIVGGKEKQYYRPQK